MAARKSCTHLTWSEAKAKSGEGNGKGGKKTVAKNVSHGKILADKIIMKQQPSKQNKISDRQAARKARKEEERAKKIEEKRREEKEQQLLQAVVKPHHQSLERMRMTASALSKKIQQEKPKEAREEFNYNEIDILKTIADCKQSQLDEILALEAMCTNDEFRISEGCELENLRNKMEALDETDETSLRSIARHPPISFTLQMTVEDEAPYDLAAHVLMSLEFPNLYPLDGAKPRFKVLYFMITDKTAVCNANKPLESLGFLDESNLIDCIESEVETLLPYPCVYEITSTWLPDNLFSKFITMKTV
ncbi:unnamed protein product [Cylindrotheca closterium]|uniref:RWD domain-containing protein n=1 Tax=Cylindrotheca closterium TaxID=2856 RepID=A0AAD2FQQ3_9STRA|nr:unnamed protein product [Cylindrotheca closterium]